MPASFRRPLPLAPLAAALALAAAACGGDPKPQGGISSRRLADALVQSNRRQLDHDTQCVVSYIRLMQWDMRRTRSGIWYQVLESDSAAPRVREGDLVALAYSVSLLGGREIYSSDSAGPKLFKVTQGGVESGLEEGVLLLRGGDSARFIMPQYQAHHLLGDGAQIPPLATIVYHLRVLEIARQGGGAAR